MAGRKSGANPRELRERSEAFDEYREEYLTSRSTGKVIALRPFSARVIRKGDQPDQVRGVELVAKGQVVEIPIDRGEDAVQGAATVAYMRVNGDFAPTKREATNPPDDDEFHGTKTTDQVTRERKHAAALAGEQDGEQMTLTRGELKDLVAAAVEQAMKGKGGGSPKGGGKKAASKAEAEAGAEAA